MMCRPTKPRDPYHFRMKIERLSQRRLNQVVSERLTAENDGIRLTAFVHLSSTRRTSSLAKTGNVRT